MRAEDPSHRTQGRRLSAWLWRWSGPSTARSSQSGRRPRTGRDCSGLPTCGTGTALLPTMLVPTHVLGAHSPATGSRRRGWPERWRSAPTPFARQPERSRHRTERLEPRGLGQVEPLLLSLTSKLNRLRWTSRLRHTLCQFAKDSWKGNLCRTLSSHPYRAC